MPTQQEIESKFWDALKSDRTVMLGLAKVDDAHMRPMTALVDGDAERGPLWIFTANDTGLVQALVDDSQAVATFASKGHDLFAMIHGRLALDNDRDMIERLWNPYIAAWYPGGKTDPKLALLRFDTEGAEIWLDESSFITGIKLLLGADPKKDYRDKVAKVSLS